MISSDNTIPDSMLDLLRRCKGQMLDSVLCTDTGNAVQTLSIQVVILRFKDYDIELWNEEQPNFPEGLTDIAKIRVIMNEEKNLQSPVGKRDANGVFVPLNFIPTEVRKIFKRITIHNESVKCFNAHGIEQFKFDNTRAIVISLGETFLHIEKRNYWSEIWNVSMQNTDSVSPSSDWENDEDASYEVHPYSLDL